MAEILAVWELGAGTGHCVNLLPLLEGLSAQGHRIHVAMRNVVTARKLFSHLPVSYFQAPFQHGPSPVHFDAVNSFAHVLHNTGFGSEESLQALLAASRSLFELLRPDLVICDHSPIALLASYLYDVRRVVVGAGFYAPPDVTPMLRFDSPAGEAAPRDLIEEAILQRINRILAAEGKRPLDRVSELYAQADESFLLTFPELDHYGERPGSEYWGMWSPPGGVEPEWGPGEGPRVYAYLQPAQRSWNPALVVMALADLGVPSLVYAPTISLDALRKLPAPNVRFEDRRVDIDRVVQQCGAAITHGNNGTVTRLALGGVPQAVLPLNSEQTMIASRLEAIGVARSAAIREPEKFVDVIAQVVRNDQFSAAAKAFASRYSSYDAAAVMEQVVERISRLLA